MDTLVALGSAASFVYSLSALFLAPQERTDVFDAGKLKSAN
ncbi:MAG: hypothetical protein ACI4NN_08110 [Pyramidobacter sp.]|jgi:hypothetical protein